MFKDNRAIAAIVSICISILSVYGLNSLTDVNGIAISWGIDFSGMGWIIPLVIILFLILVARIPTKKGRFGLGKTLMIIAIILIGLSFTNLIYEKGALIAIAVFLFILGLIIAGRKKFKLRGNWEKGTLPPKFQRPSRPKKTQVINNYNMHHHDHNYYQQQAESARDRATRTAEEDFRREEERRRKEQERQMRYAGSGSTVGQSSGEIKRQMKIEDKRQKQMMLEDQRKQQKRMLLEDKRQKKLMIEDQRKQQRMIERQERKQLQSRGKTGALVPSQSRALVPVDNRQLIKEQKQMEKQNKETLKKRFIRLRNLGIALQKRYHETGDPETGKQYQEVVRELQEIRKAMK
jgi:hypothetical protein